MHLLGAALLFLARLRRMGGVCAQSMHPSPSAVLSCWQRRSGSTGSPPTRCHSGFHLQVTCRTGTLAGSRRKHGPEEPASNPEQDLKPSPMSQRHILPDFSGRRHTQEQFPGRGKARAELSSVSQPALNPGTLLGFSRCLHPRRPVDPPQHPAAPRAPRSHRVLAPAAGHQGPPPCRGGTTTRGELSALPAT